MNDSIFKTMPVSSLDVSHTTFLKHFNKNILVLHCHLKQQYKNSGKV